MSIVHPIDQAWITAGQTGAQNYDEFASDAEITEIIRANPASALAIEMPHCAPESVGTSFHASLPLATAKLQQAKATGAYTAGEQVVVLYRITGDDGTAYGMLCMVDTDQISTSADEPGLVIRNEDVFEEKVRERVALTGATGHLLSPVLLLQSGRGEELHAALTEAVAAVGPPAATDVDQHGRTHELWPVPPGETADQLCTLAGAGELVVADGNHRSLAAQTGGLARFLAVVTTPPSVQIQPYNRLVTEAPGVDGHGWAGLAVPGCRVETVTGAPALPPPPQVAYLYAAGQFYKIELPIDPAADRVDNLDHALVERLVVGEALGLAPEDKRVVYVGGDYPPAWLCAEVDAGRAAAAIMIAAVSTEDFIAVNLARQKMPRKSTWFTPKARAGLVLAELAVRRDL